MKSDNCENMCGFLLMGFLFLINFYIQHNKERTVIPAFDSGDLIRSQIVQLIEVLNPVHKIQV